MPNRHQLIQNQAMLKALQTWWEKIPPSQGFTMIPDQALEPVRLEQAEGRTSIQVPMQLER